MIKTSRKNPENIPDAFLMVDSGQIDRKLYKPLIDDIFKAMFLPSSILILYSLPRYREKQSDTVQDRTRRFDFSSMQTELMGTTSFVIPRACKE